MKSNYSKKVQIKKKIRETKLYSNEKHVKSKYSIFSQEFNALKPELKRQIGSIMDRHPVFSTALIARRCFATKSASNEYHFGRPGIPVTLRELEEKMSRDVASLDHFKHMAKVMSERMVASVKGKYYFMFLFFRNIF